MVKVGLGFIGSALIGYSFSPFWAAVGGGISGLVSSAIFGNEGGLFFGFTLTAMIRPLIYSLFFYKKPTKVGRVITVTIVVTIVVNISLNTLWLHLLYGVNLKIALLQRLPKKPLLPGFK